jgi:hypothetical protein
MMIMGAACSSRMLVHLSCPTTQFHVPDDFNLHGLNKIANGVLKSVFWSRGIKLLDNLENCIVKSSLISTRQHVLT